MKVKKFNYTIKEVLPLSDLEQYKDHRRMKVFYNKGVCCSNPNCSRKGTQLAIGLDKKGNEHIDIYTDDFYPLNVDHWMPKFLGGSDNIKNLVPMCYGCNVNKANKNPNDFNVVDLYDKTLNTHTHNSNNTKLFFSKLYRKITKDDIGLKVFKKRRKKLIEVGIISRFIINPHTNDLAFMVEGNEKSMNHLKIGLTRKTI